MTESREPHIYEPIGEVSEIDDDFDLPENWQDLSDAEYQALFDSLGIFSDESEDERIGLESLPVVAVVGRPNVGHRWLGA